MIYITGSEDSVSVWKEQPEQMGLLYGKFGMQYMHVLNTMLCSFDPVVICGVTELRF